MQGAPQLGSFGAYCGSARVDNPLLRSTEYVPGFVRPAAVEFAVSEEQQRKLVVDMYVDMQQSALGKHVGPKGSGGASLNVASKLPSLTLEPLVAQRGMDVSIGDTSRRLSLTVGTSRMNTFEEMLRIRFRKATAEEIAYMLRVVEEHKHSVKVAEDKASYKRNVPILQHLFRSFDTDGSGAIDEGEFMSSMLGCRLRSFGLDNSQLLAKFHEHAEPEVTGGEKLLNIDQFEALLHSSGLVQHVREMTMNRTRSLNGGTKYHIMGNTKKWLETQNLEMGMRVLNQLDDASSGHKDARPSLADRRHSVLHNIGFGQSHSDADT